MKKILECNGAEYLPKYMQGFENKSEAARSINITSQLSYHYELDNIKNPEKYAVLLTDGKPKYFIEIKKVL